MDASYTVRRNRPTTRLTCFLALILMITCTLVSSANAQSLPITLTSSSTTESVILSLGDPRLDNGDTSGLVFQPVDVNGPPLGTPYDGSYGTSTTAPPSSPAGTVTVNIAHPVPACYPNYYYCGQSGLFRMTFTLPSPVPSGIQLTGAGNVDDRGYAFLNGNKISAELSNAGNVTYSTSTASYFKAGTNEFVISDKNIGGGPSGAAFYAKITAQCNVRPVPWVFFQAIDGQGHTVPWACNIYDSPYPTSDYSRYCPLQRPLTRTISQEGCALTALTMALDTVGAGVGNPGNLNDLMNSAGLFDGHDVNFSDTVEFVSISNSILYGSKPLNYTEITPASTKPQVLENALCQAGYPVIVAVKLTPTKNGRQKAGHFVLVTGKSGNDFTIADPGHPYNTLLQASYPRGFQTRGYVTDPVGDQSSLHLSVHNAELLISDPFGRRAGFDPLSPNDLEEIPQSAYSRDSLENDETGEPDPDTSYFLNVNQPQSGSYQVTITGIELTSYALSIRAYSSDGSRQTPVIVNGVANVGSTSTFQVQIASTAGAGLQVARIATIDSTISDITNSLRLGQIDNEGVANSLSETIQNVESAIQRGQKGTARNILRAFKNDVNAQSGKHISAVVAQILLQDADSLVVQN